MPCASTFVFNEAGMMLCYVFVIAMWQFPLFISVGFGELGCLE